MINRVKRKIRSSGLYRTCGNVCRFTIALVGLLFIALLLLFVVVLFMPLLILSLVTLCEIISHVSVMS